jgi:hypothetical protein
MTESFAALLDESLSTLDYATWINSIWSCIRRR